MVQISENGREGQKHIFKTISKLGILAVTCYPDLGAWHNLKWYYYPRNTATTPPPNVSLQYRAIIHIATIQGRAEQSSITWSGEWYYNPTNTTTTCVITIKLK